MIVGVTGGMGAGKSTVCDVFLEQGALVIEADVVGHVVVRDPVVVGQLAEAFGPDIVDENGELIRREVARRAFVSEAGLERLNAIVWPPLIEQIKTRAEAALKEESHRPVVIDAALLVEWGNPKGLCDVLVVVTAPLPVRRERTMERLGISAEEADARMASQKSVEEKVKVADYVIENGASLEAGRRKAQQVWGEILNV